MADKFQLPKMPDMPNMPEIPKMEDVKDSLDNAKNSVNENLNQFSSQASVYGNTTNEFLNSNAMVAKFGFLLLVVILFLIFVNLGIKFISYLVSPSKNPYLINGIISGNAAMNIPQDPQNADYIAIPFSNNAERGIEFTWNFWIYISGISKTTSPSNSHVFNKGDASFDTNTGIAKVNNAPGVYISNTSNKMTVIMDTVNGTTGITNKIEVDGIPIGNWVNVSIRLQNTILDVYINGAFTERKVLAAAPKQNYDDINIGYNGGFSGNLSNLRYYSHALSVFEMQNIVLYGPNLATNSATASPPYTPYLSYQWYSNQT